MVNLTTCTQPECLGRCAQGFWSSLKKPSNQPATRCFPQPQAFIRPTFECEAAADGAFPDASSAGPTGELVLVVRSSTPQYQAAAPAPAFGTELWKTYQGECYRIFLACNLAFGSFHLTEAKLEV